jgi:hypothetical protein
MTCIYASFVRKQLYFRIMYLKPGNFSESRRIVFVTGHLLLIFQIVNVDFILYFLKIDDIIAFSSSMANFWPVKNKYTCISEHLPKRLMTILVLWKITNWKQLATFYVEHMYFLGNKFVFWYCLVYLYICTLVCALCWLSSQ